MHTRILYMLRDCICNYVSVLSHSIHLYLLGSGDELRHYHRVLLRHIGCKAQKTGELLLIVAHIHCRP